jgi:hypothetical protein
MTHKRVTFNGEEYWLHQSGSGFPILLSPLDHYSEDGELLVNPFTAVSYAIIEEDFVKRYGEVIGKASDVLDVIDI